MSAMPEVLPPPASEPEPARFDTGRSVALHTVRPPPCWSAPRNQYKQTHSQSDLFQTCRAGVVGEEEGADIRCVTRPLAHARSTVPRAAV
eukprot:745575-Rhodomonas_salina.2